MPSTEADNDAVVAGRRALREITGALGVSVLLLAVLVAVILAAHRHVAAVVGVIAIVVVVLVSVVVMARVRRAGDVRTEAIDRERRGRELLDRTLVATRRLVELDSTLDVRRRICEVAREVFDCAAVSLWEVEDEHLLLLERVPLQHPYRSSDRRPIAELPGLRESLDRSVPLFVRDLREAATGMTQATAETLGTGSLLNVPVTSGGVPRMDLVLSWTEVLPEPTEGERVAAQRFADQAVLALEQSRYRAAQAEIASLNRTLGRMVQSVPLFHAAGSLDEVAATMCAAALDVFEADAAALWMDTGEAIELVHRQPPTDAFGTRQRIVLGEHPAFAEDLATTAPRFVADVEHEDPVLWERFARHSGSRSQLRVPLASTEPARALMVLSWTTPVAPPSAQVSALATRFADQAAVALAEAARREAQREATELHGRFEESLLPSIALASPDAHVATFYRPGDERLSLGGDLYDCLELGDGSLALLIGDVAGHGAAAAALGAGLRSAWRALVLAGHDLPDLLRGLQEVCIRERKDPYLFVTAICARIPADRSVLELASAGHPMPLVPGAPGVGDDRNGPPLGVTADAAWPVATVPLGRPASVVLYTDGLVEGRVGPATAERLGVGPIERHLAGVAPGAVGEADLRALVDLATEANGAGLADDVALLALNLR